MIVTLRVVGIVTLAAVLAVAGWLLLSGPAEEAEATAVGSSGATTADPAVPETVEAPPPAALPAFEFRGPSPVLVAMPDGTPGVVVSGTLVAPATGGGVPDVSLEIVWEGSGEIVDLEPTDAGGWFASEPVPLGKVAIRVPNPHHLLDPRKPERGAAVAGLTLGAEASEDLVIEHPYAGAIDVRVSDRKGGPLAGAEVRLLAAAAKGGPPSSVAGMTDADGRLHVGGLRPGLGVIASAHLAGRGSASAAPVLPGSAAAPPEVRIVLGGTGRIAGRVLLPGGDPAPRAKVRLLPATGDPRARESTADAEGRFGFLAVPEGRRTVSVEWSAAWGPTQDRVSPDAEVEVADGGEAEITLHLAGGLGTAGIVLSPEGAPVAGATVTAARTGPDGMWIPSVGRATTGADGRFSVSVDRPGLLRLTASLGPFDASEPVAVLSGAGDVRLILDPSRGVLRVRVLGVAGERWDDLGQVIIRSGDSTEKRWIRGGIPTSVFLAPGPYRIAAGARGRGTVVRDVVVSDSGAPHVEDFHLAKGRSITGQLLDARGLPQEGATIASVDEDSAVWLCSQVKSGADGSFVIDTLPPEGGRIAVLRAGKPALTVPVDGPHVVIRLP